MFNYFEKFKRRKANYSDGNKSKIKKNVKDEVKKSGSFGCYM